MHADPDKTLKIPGNLVCDPDVYSRRVGKYATYKHFLCVIILKCVIFYGISLKPCNTGSGYNPTLWVLQRSANFLDVFGANLVFVASCSEQL